MSLDVEEQLRQALTSPWPTDAVLMVVTDLKAQGHDRELVYRRLEKMRDDAKARGSTYEAEALDAALSIVAGYCPPDQAIWEGLLEFTRETLEV